MTEITYNEMLLAITVTWILVRAAVCSKNKKFELGHEMRLLLFYVCIIVIARFVYFPLHRTDGRIGTLIFDPERLLPPWLNLTPFTFIHQRYDGWEINIIGNLTMFIPVGIVLPVCFKRLDNVIKVVLVGFGMTLFIELSQLLFYDRGTDVDDVILNTIGTFIGAALFFTIKELRQRRRKRNDL